MKAIQVTFDTHAPDEWNTPVPVEVCDSAMRIVGEPHILNLAHGGTIQVERAGRYYVMATLPTGESVGTSVEVTATGDPAAAVLVPSESSPQESLAWAFTRQRLPREQQSLSRRRFRWMEDERLSMERRSTERRSMERLPRENSWFWRLIDTTKGAQRGSEFRPYIGLYPMLTVEVLSIGSQRERWTLKRTLDKTSWDADVHDADPRLLGRLTIARFPPVNPSKVKHPSTRWYPLFVHYRAHSKQALVTSTLVAVPAGQALTQDDLLQDSVVLFAQAGSASEDAPAVQALVRGARAQAETLLSYFENGVFTAARQLSASVISKAISLLEDKLEDPFGAAISGYVLLRTATYPEEQLDRQRWMRNLANGFPLLPDGAVIYGASLLRGEGADNPTRVAEARYYLLEAVSRGIPTYTMGLRLLFDSLRSLAEERKDDTELAVALARVRAVAAYADWTAQTTTLTYSSHTPAASALEILR